MTLSNFLLFIFVKIPHLSLVFQVVLKFSELCIRMNLEIFKCEIIPIFLFEIIFSAVELISCLSLGFLANSK